MDPDWKKLNRKAVFKMKYKARSGKIQEILADILQTEESYAVMITEWKERMRLRSEEISSIEEAIKILTSDEARDTMSASFESQGNFLQEDESKPFSHKRVR